MDLEVRVNETVQVFDRYQEAEAYIVEQLRYWNNFENENKPISITITRIKNNGPPALGVKVTEDIQSEDLFGRR